MTPRVSISPWARDQITPAEEDEVRAYAREHGVNIDIRFSRSARGYVAVVDGREGVDQRRPVYAFRKATAPAIASFLTGPAA